MVEGTGIANRTLRLVTETRGGLRADLLDLKQRMTSIEQGQALMTQELGRIREDMAFQSARTDRFDQRLARIERRLELVNSTAT
jgi:septation ring formation regulator EzrA